MATPTKGARAGQEGLTLIEALVIVVVTALIALLLLPLASQSAHRNFTLSERNVDAADAANAESEFRTIVQGAEQVAAPGGGALALAGEANSLVVFPTLAAGAACAGAGAEAWLRLRIERRAPGGGALICETPEGSRDMLAWRQGDAAFWFSSDGASWDHSWRDNVRDAQASREGAVMASRRAPLVRFSLSRPGVPDLDWIARAGWTEAARRDAPSPQATAP